MRQADLTTFWVPVRLSKAVAPGEMRIAGMATLDGVIDLDQQLLEHTGVINSLDYLRLFGKINWNHEGGPENILGDIVLADIRKSGGSKGLYIEAVLNPKVKRARHAYNLMKGGTKLGFSVQGVTLKLSKATIEGYPVEKIDEAFVSEVALTGEPKNYRTFAQVVKSLHQEAIRKSLTAGAGTDSAAFTGGRALTRESLIPAENIVQLASHFRRINGSLPRNGEAYGRAFRAFVQQWALSPETEKALAQHLRRRSS